MNSEYDEVMTRIQELEREHFKEPRHPTRCSHVTPAIVLDLDDPYFHGITLPSALDGYDHVHSTTGVCVKNARGPMCVTSPDVSGPPATM